MLDAESGGGAERIGFIADTVAQAAGNVARGVAGAAPALVATQTRFSVDPQQAQKLIDGLTEARNQLQDLNMTAQQLMYLPSGAKDPYSAKVVEVIQRTAGNGVGGYGWANTMAAKALTATINKIEKSLDDYRNRDEENADAFNGGGK